MFKLLAFYLISIWSQKNRKASYYLSHTEEASAWIGKERKVHSIIKNTFRINLKIRTNSSVQYFIVKKIPINNNHLFCVFFSSILCYTVTLFQIHYGMVKQLACVDKVWFDIMFFMLDYMVVLKFLQIKVYSCNIEYLFCIHFSILYYF